MRKRGYIAAAVIVFASVISITSWAYWKDDLKVKATIPFVYDVEIEINEEKAENESKPEENIEESSDSKMDEKDITITTEVSEEGKKEVTQ